MGPSTATSASSKASSRKSPTLQTCHRFTPTFQLRGPSAERSGRCDALSNRLAIYQSTNPFFLKPDDWRVVVAPGRSLSRYLWKFSVSEKIPVLPSLCRLGELFSLRVGLHACVFARGGSKQAASSTFFCTSLNPQTVMLCISDSFFPKNSSHSFDKEISILVPVLILIVRRRPLWNR